MSVMSLKTLLTLTDLTQAVDEVRLAKFKELTLDQWFSLDRYQESLSLYEWSFEVYVRSMCYTHSSFGSSFSDSGINVFSEYLLERNDLLAKYEAIQIPNWALYKPFETPIKIISAREIWSADEELAAINLEAWVDYANPISVNLGYSDEELIKEFKGYLKRRRADESDVFLLAKSIKDRVIEWHDFRLIALFDLLYWREFFDKSLTYTQIGNIVWPDNQIEIEQRVRKVGLPLVERVFSEAVAKTLFFESLKTV